MPETHPTDSASHSRARNDRRRWSLIRRCRARLGPADRTLAVAYRRLAQSVRAGRDISSGGEWLLDNHFLIRRIIRSLRAGLTRGFERSLPHTHVGPFAGHPRIYGIARDLCVSSHYRIDPALLRTHFGKFRARQEITIGELWALPLVLRLALIEQLAKASGVAVGGEAGQEGVRAIDDAMVDSCVRSLQALEAANWKTFVEAVSIVDHNLREDPAGIYTEMDFVSRNVYRSVVEELARALNVAESFVARAAVAVAAEATVDSSDEAERSRHVGYYLVGGGRGMLERELGRRPWSMVFRGRLSITAAFWTYVGLIATVALAHLWAFGSLLDAGGLRWALVPALALATLPALSIGGSLIDWLTNLAVSPTALPKLEFPAGIPERFRTLVVVPCLIGDADEIAQRLDRLEQHYTADGDPALEFALVTDFADATSETTPSDERLLGLTLAGIRDLNRKHGSQERRPFHLFHRRRRFNPMERMWLGWERKRGKLEELNRLLLGAQDTSYVLHEGEGGDLGRFRFVITLDADTRLPRGAARRLVETAAHPLNRPLFDDRGRVITGYTVIQPRVEVSPAQMWPSRFVRLFAGDRAYDIYTHASSNVYQDLFGEGSFTGKGIYDVRGFDRSVRNRIPENQVLSHDLLEGALGRAALASDVVVYESYPPHYLAFSRRSNRWIRGDWQILSWLRRTMPTATGERIPNTLSSLSRWKIWDNLRRSLMAPTLLVMLLLSWLAVPDIALPWTLLTGLLLATPVLTELAGGAIRGMAPTQSRREVAHLVAGVPASLGRWLVRLAFLPHEAGVSAGAAVRALYRSYVSKRRRLQWIPAASVAREPTGRLANWRSMAVGPLLAVVTAAALISFRPRVFVLAAPILLLWAMSPEVAVWLGRRRRGAHPDQPMVDHGRLRVLARKTWLYFETFVGPTDHWLPPDHFQESPLGEVAHRTSPTNIGLALVASVSAVDLGYLGLREFRLRTASTFDAMAALPRHRGHWLNWYDTRTLAPLEPRYVSTVDSGNLAASLIVTGEACRQWAAGVLAYDRRCSGLCDTLAALRETLDSDPNHASESLRVAIGDISESLAAVASPAAWAATLEQVETTAYAALHRGILAALADSADGGGLPLAEIRHWVRRTQAHLRSMRRDLDDLYPWLAVVAIMPHELASLNDPVMGELKAALDHLPPLTGYDSFYRSIRRRIVAAREHAARLDPATAAAVEAWLARVDAALDPAAAALAGELADELDQLGARALTWVADMDFAALYDRQRGLFQLGHDLGLGRLDPHYYDLLASEARLASLVAIAKGDVPLEHWGHLGRPIGLAGGSKCLLSWSGTMFEYLMPELFTRPVPTSLLGSSARAAVREQIAYGARTKVPWGISESSYSMTDARAHYQYRAFGVPSLGFKRGLDDDLVVAPYASALAVHLDPAATLANFAALDQASGVGTYGFYEALDYTPERSPVGGSHTVVRSYMSHHQGMVLISLANFLGPQEIVGRFESNALVRSVDLLLYERAPGRIALETPQLAQEGPSVHRGAEVAMLPWDAEPEAAAPDAHVLGNGRYGVVITAAGAGFSWWRDVALTPERADPTLESAGTWVYVADADQDTAWTIGSACDSEAGDRSARFFPHMAELLKTEHGLATGMRVSVSPDDDVEIRIVDVTNLEARTRDVVVTCYSPVVLADARAERQHPAFVRLFVSARADPDQRAVTFERRLRGPNERPAALRWSVVHDETQAASVELSASRRQFIGRPGSVRAPMGLVGLGPTSLGTSIPLDPAAVMRCRLRIGPHASAKLAFVAAAAESSQAARATTKRYSTLMQCEVVVDAARRAAESEARQQNWEAPDFATYQRLLSGVLFPRAALRADAATVARNVGGQSDLWRHAISGDLPIVVVRLPKGEELAFVRRIVRAQRFWNIRGLSVDVVFVSEGAAGYADPLRERVAAIVTQAQLHPGIGRGHAVLVHRHTLEPWEEDALATAARVVIDASAVSLEDWIASRVHERGAQRFSGPSVPRRDRRSAAAFAELPRPLDLVADNGLGGFDAAGAYVIQPELGVATPAPWANVVANPKFGFVVTEAGGGYTWARNAGLGRLTAWHNDPTEDPVSERLFVRDEDTGCVWSPLPGLGGPRASHRVRHDAGSTRFECVVGGLEHTLDLFVAPADPIKLFALRVHNRESQRRRLTVTLAVDWVLGRDRERDAPFVVTAFDADAEVLLARNPWTPQFRDDVAFLASDRPLSGFTADRSEFLGRGGDPKRPRALELPGLSGAVGGGLDPCGVVQVRVDVEPLADASVCFYMGQEHGREQALELVRRSRETPSATVLGEVQRGWDAVLGTIEVRTPDQALDLMVNRWLLYQTLASRVWGRTGLYQSSGAFGFRDQLQDVMALCWALPSEARAHIIEAASHQFREGDVLHWWHPPAGKGIRSRCSDDLVWLPAVTAHYVATTGDTEILEEVIPFLEGPEVEIGESERYGDHRVSTETGTLYDHCCRALRRAHVTGAHGLPLIGSGDWNDGFDHVGLEGRGESVWLGWFLYATLTDFAALCGERREPADRDDMLRRAEELRVALEDSWDGRWYRRGYYDSGAPLGSAACEEARIDAIAQSWAVISGAASHARAREAMESVWQYLVREDDRLVLLFDPPFDRGLEEPGYIKAYPPGVRENGGQYTHAAIWTAWAMARLGDTDRAYRMFRLLNPILSAATPARAAAYKAEPYVVAADVYNAPGHRGRGGWTWYTGSAAWLYRFAVEEILGIRLVRGELVIAPKIPADWPGYEATLRRGDAVLHVVVDNSAHAGADIIALTMDNVRVPVDVPLRFEPGRHEIRVELGRAAPAPSGRAGNVASSG